VNPDVVYAVPALYAETTFDPLVQEPPLHPWLAKDYRLVFYVLGTDALWRRTIQLGDRQVYFGCLLESLARPGTFLLVLRGTAMAVEWAEDAEGRQRAHPQAGRVEDGFYGLYNTLVARAPGSGRDAPLIASVAKAVGNGRCTVLGHSLGAAEAIIASVDVSQALLQGRTSLRAFASPHPGDATFCQLAATHTPDQRAYAHEPDLVPKVPVSLPLIGEYSSLPNLITLPAGGIKDDPLHNHHLVSYVWKMAGRAGVELLGPAAVPYLDSIIDMDADPQAPAVSS
jgi:triacylglycerol lipase